MISKFAEVHLKKRKKNSLQVKSFRGHLTKQPIVHDDIKQLIVHVHELQVHIILKHTFLLKLPSNVDFNLFDCERLWTAE